MKWVFCNLREDVKHAIRMIHMGKCSLNVRN